MPDFPCSHRAGGEEMKNGREDIPRGLDKMAVAIL